MEKETPVIKGNTNMDLLYGALDMQLILQEHNADKRALQKGVDSIPKNQSVIEGD